MIEIYAAASLIEAERIVSFLQSSGIGARLQVQDDLPQIPTEREYTLFAPLKHRQKAIELIANARLDQIITDTGMFL